MPHTLLRCLLPFMLLLATCRAGSAAEPATATVRVDGHEFQVELAVSEAERARGLMHRERLAADQGMLFVQPQPAPAAFWMKNTLIPLDMLFFDAEGRLLALHQNVPPCTIPDCPIYPAAGPVKYILEVNAGTVRRLGIGPDARMVLPSND
ncbi:MAG TPA: DUF192 domain-containing protein [Candidatus Competibacteraceae bacterium]|nr:DUF192 domain-containing protein [Candidatus Competibacteraceae bacterium]